MTVPELGQELTIKSVITNDTSLLLFILNFNYLFIGWRSLTIDKKIYITYVEIPTKVGRYLLLVTNVIPKHDIHSSLTKMLEDVYVGSQRRVDILLH